MHEGDGPEYFTLLLAATLGMALMGSASNLLMLFMAVEMASLPSYVLAGFRKTHRIGAEASLKYVLFGAATSAVMAYGLSLLYGLYGTLQLYTTQAGPGLAELMVVQGATSPLLVVAVFGLIVGVGFKISAVPFHFWCPDVFEGASIDVTTFLSVASKGAGLVLLLRVAMAVAEAAGYQPIGVTTWTAVVIGVLGSLTCTVGNTAAYFQNNIKRLLAYSSIAHAGYMLCAVSLLVRHGQDLPDPGNAAAQAVLVYLAVYVFMNLGAFTVAALVARQAGTEDLSGYRGLGRRSPLLAGCMTVFLLSLIGLPPLAGFWAKVNVLLVLIQNGGWWWVLVAVIGVNTIVSAFYYFRVIKPMYLESSDAPSFTPGPLGTGLGVACAVVLVVLFVGWNGVSSLSTAYSRLRPAGAPAAGAPPTTQPSPPGPVAAAP
jgi:NADH-quinone oxidoreductase subunit N